MNDVEENFEQHSHEMERGVMTDTAQAVRDGTAAGRGGGKARWMQRAAAVFQLPRLHRFHLEACRGLPLAKFLPAVREFITDQSLENKHDTGGARGRFCV